MTRRWEAWKEAAAEALDADRSRLTHWRSYIEGMCGLIEKGIAELNCPKARTDIEQMLANLREALNEGLAQAGLSIEAEDESLGLPAPEDELRSDYYAGVRP